MMMRAVALGIVVAGSALVASVAQDAMPGMAMGTKQAEGTDPKQIGSMQDMGRVGQQQPKQTPKPNRTRQPEEPMPADMQGMEMGNGRAASAAASDKSSVEQQAGQAGVLPGKGSDARSGTQPFSVLQEPEAIDLRTGGDLPVPELLKDAAAQRPRTLPSFLEGAATGNPTLQEAERSVVRSREQARQIGLPPDPTVGYSAEHIRGGSYHRGEEGAFFEQEFVLGRKLALRREVYRAEGRTNELAVEVQRARVRNDVAQAFWNALAAQETAVVRDRLLKVALDAERNAHERERVGQADASDVLSAEVSAEQAKVEFVEAQRMFLARYAQLDAFAGGSGGVAHPLTGELVSPPAMDAAEAVTRDVVKSPAVKQATAEVATAEARVKEAKREVVPDLKVTAGEWYSGETLGATDVRAGWMSFAQAGVQLPLWNRNQGNVAAAEAELARSQHAVARAALWTRKETETYAQEYESARFRAERYRGEMLPRARRAYELEVMKYQQMAQDYPHVLSAQRTLFELQMGYVEALRMEWEGAVALENSALTRGLEQPSSVGEDGTMLNTPTGGGR